MGLVHFWLDWSAAQSRRAENRTRKLPETGRVLTLTHLQGGPGTGIQRLDQTEGKPSWKHENGL